MSSRYRVEYHLKSHRKDEFIDWIKGLLAAPFVLHAVSHDNEESTTRKVQGRYAEVFQDIEALISNKIEFDSHNALLGEESKTGDRESGYELIGKSRLNQLVPSIGPFFTPLPLEKAFYAEDQVKAISVRRMVAPSFNDIRHILNTAQILHFQQERNKRSAEMLQMVTFDGDVTLYEDGGSLFNTNPVIPHLIHLLKTGIYVGIVTAAGYDEPTKYEERLHGLLVAMHESHDLSVENKEHLTVMGGESNYLFQYYEDNSGKFGFRSISQSVWMSPEMSQWDANDILETLDFAEKTLKGLKERLRLPEQTEIIRKQRAVGLVPGEIYDPISQKPKKIKLAREQLEEIVLTLHKTLQSYPPARRVQFSCFDGGSDVWCDIGGKDLGVRALQHYYNPQQPISPSRTLHIGDQFAPMGSANDIKARLAGCTLWIASPEETVQMLAKLTAA